VTRRSLALTLALLCGGCVDLFGTEFDDVEDAVFYRAASVTPPPASVDRLKVMTYNIKFGGGRIDFFYDCFGDRVLMTEREVRDNIAAVAAEIKRVDPDIVLLQEVDVQSKRSQYVDQVQLLLDALPGLNHGAYVSQWKADFIPSDGLGRMDSGSAILSRWPFTSGRRLALPKISTQDALTQYFYLKRAILDTRLQIPGLGQVALVNLHAAAYANDGTRQQHVARFKQELDSLAGTKTFFVAGGDLNTLPPDVTKLNGFADAVCEDEDLQVQRDASERAILVDFYRDFSVAITREAYGKAEQQHFTHSVSSKVFWNRKLDYLFSSGRALEPGQTHQGQPQQQTMPLSDHCPVSGVFAP
jgi:endonuclease/exonuclease/phosphatase family metal-dependent hydrolase